MIRAFMIVVFFMSYASVAHAEYKYENSRLDHVLGQGIPNSVVVFGELEPTNGNQALKAKFPANRSGFGFRVKSVILGDSRLGEKTLLILDDRFTWPKDLVSKASGNRCILVLTQLLQPDEEFFWIAAVAPGRDQKYPLTKENAAALRIIQKELLSALRDEKSVPRQIALLQQLAPILEKNDVVLVESFLSCKDPWVRRAALAGLVYATEEEKYFLAAAQDIQDFVKGTKEDDFIEGPTNGVKRSPESWLSKYYFFLDSSARRPGSQFSRTEAEKYVRIIDGLQKQNIFNADVNRRIRDQ